MNKELLSSLVGKIVIVTLGGIGPQIGKLLYGGDDHFALLTEKEGVVYFKTAAVKSLSQNMKPEVLVKVSEKDHVFMKEDTFGAILNSMITQWVKINCGDPENLEGVLEQSNDHYITLLMKDEVIRIATIHIKRISHGVDIKKKESTDIQGSSCHHPILKKRTRDLSLKNTYSKKINSALYSDELEGAKFRT